MALTTASTPLFTGGNVAQYTKVDAPTDDTNLFSLGNIFSILNFGAGAGGGVDGSLKMLMSMYVK